MCGRFTFLTREELEDAVRAIEGQGAVRLRADVERGQARPGSSVLALAPSRNGLAIAPLVWGFESSGGKLVFNMRIESALGGSSFWKNPVRNGRCIMPVASFFEPHRTKAALNSRSGRRAKRQYEFSSPDSSPLLLAGVQVDGRLAIATTEPNAWVSPIHPRMPLVLSFEEASSWIDGDLAPLADRSRFELVATSEGEGFSDADDLQLSLF